MRIIKWTVASRRIKLALVSFFLTAVTITSYFAGKNSVAIKIQVGGRERVIVRNEPRSGVDIVGREAGPSQGLFLLILVSTSPHDTKHRQLRSVIRSTWGRACKGEKTIELYGSSSVVHDVTCRLVFFTGRTHSKQKNALIEQESDQYGDVIVTDTLDSYRNITDKLLLAMTWARHMNPKFVLKTDDDIYVNIENLLTKLLFDETLPTDVYGGRLYVQAPVIRDPHHKHYVSSLHYPNTTFPPYCAGGIYLLSGHLLSKLLIAAKTIRHITVDDGYIGILMHKINVKALHIPEIIIDSDMPDRWDRFLRCGVSFFIGFGHRLGEDDMGMIYGRIAIYKLDRRPCYAVIATSFVTSLVSLLLLSVIGSVVINSMFSFYTLSH